MLRGNRTREFVVAISMTIAALQMFGVVRMNAQIAESKVLPTQSLSMPDWQKAAGGKKAFEAASVRASRLGTPTRGVEQLAQLDVAPLSGGLFSANAPLIFYITFAFKIDDTSESARLSAQLPDWAWTNSFDIKARSYENPTRDQLRLMLQSLLEERFKLAMHTEVRPLPVYALVLGKQGRPGPQLFPHPEDEKCVVRPDSVESLPLSTHKRPVFCGIDKWRSEDHQLHLRMVNVTLDQAANYLSAMGAFYGGLGSRPFLDRTGLAGHFDLNIEFMPKNSDVSQDSSEDAGGRSLVDALRRQLGLELKKGTGLITTYVIDHIEMPSAN